MAGLPPDMEILAHVAAPSTSADDAVYRQLAQAYLSFQPASRTKISPPAAEQHEPASSLALSFDGAIDNRSSPRLRARAWRPPPSQISDSYPMPEIHAPTRGLEQHLQTFAPSQVDVPSSIPPPPEPRIIPVTPTPALRKRKPSEEHDQTVIERTLIASSPPDLEIRPPSPPGGTGAIEPGDLVSGKLADLARDLSSRFRPRARRALDPFERGYWLLDCAGWPAQTRAEAWAFLANYLRSGLAGWGVWCTRDPDHGSIRLYCWGHVVMHTYLLLYLASGRQIKGTGAAWFGADGELVLEVPRS